MTFSYLFNDISCGDSCLNTVTILIYKACECIHVRVYMYETNLYLITTIFKCSKVRYFLKTVGIL